MFLEVVKDDGGQSKGSNPTWWNSWDFSITDPSNSNLDVTSQQLQNGHNYTVHVRLHIAPSAQPVMCPSPDTDFVQAEVYLCFPFAATTPTNAKTLLLKTFAVDPAQFQTDPTLTKSKVLSVSVDHVFQHNTADPTDDGHRCLIARCFQHGLINSTSPTDFFVPDDQHYGQRNLFIAAAQPGPMKIRFPVFTLNGNAKKAVPARLRAVVDLQPGEQLLELVLPQLRQIEGFKEVVTNPAARGFALQLPDFPGAQIRDHSRPNGEPQNGEDKGHKRHKKGDGNHGDQPQQPFYEALIEMKPAQETTFFFEVDTSDDPVGAARVYHVTQIDQRQRVIGGVTVVTVVGQPRVE
jgi:hypothetical protein